MPTVEGLLRSKPVAWALVVVPGFWPAWPLFVRSDASALADPLKFILHHLGFVACLLLALALALSPLRILFPRWGVALALNRHRRLVGVSAFAYALLHFAAQALYVYDGGWGTLASEIQKPFQLTGLVALVILAALAITSLRKLAGWLGARAWKNLHRLAYLAAVLAAYHQAAARKTFPMQVVWIFGPLAALELARIWKWRREAAATRRAARE